MWFRFKTWLMGLFQRSTDYVVELSDVEWKEDADGWYWVAPVYKNGKQCHLTGNYYQLEERLAEPDNSIVGIAFGEVIA